MALTAQTALDSTVRRSLGDGPLSALAALDFEGPVSQARWPVEQQMDLVDPDLFYSTGLSLSIVL